MDPLNSDGYSAFKNVPKAADIPVYAVMVAYSQDPSPVKLNLGIGVYRGEDGKPHVMNVVRRAEQLLLHDKSATKEYLPITGLEEFSKLSAKLVFGADSPAITENRLTTVQCLSGSGSLRIGAEFLAKHYCHHTLYLSQPTYANHPNFFLAAGLALKTYRYYDPTTHGLDFQGLLEDLGSAPSGAIVLLQACSHNPTGVDPTLEQWEQIRQLMRLKGLLPLFDCAYQGFVSGDLDMDAQSIRMFVADGGECLVAQSYSKIMGIYGERVGALSIVCTTAEVANRVNSQLKLVIRPMYSNPPIHGAAIVASILKDREMFTEWTVELKAMIERMSNLRQQLYDALCDRVAQKKSIGPLNFEVRVGGSDKLCARPWIEPVINLKQYKTEVLPSMLTLAGTPGDWSHIKRHVGMFTFSGLKEEQVAFMTTEYHIYMSSDGRINMAGLSSKTVPHLANAMHEAVTRIP